MFLNKERVGVKVERFGSKREHKYKITEDSIVMVKNGTLVMPVNFISDDFKVYDKEGKEVIEPTGRFFITAETIDPYHIILDIF